MEVSITIDGLERRVFGDYDTLQNIDWNKKVLEFVDDVEDYNKSEVQPVPGFEFVQDALDKLTIRK